MGFNLGFKGLSICSTVAPRLLSQYGRNVSGVCSLEMRACFMSAWCKSLASQLLF